MPRQLRQRVSPMNRPCKAWRACHTQLLNDIRRPSLKFFVPQYIRPPTQGGAEELAHADCVLVQVCPSVVTLAQTSFPVESIGTNTVFNTSSTNVRRGWTNCWLLTDICGFHCTLYGPTVARVNLLSCSPRPRSLHRLLRQALDSFLYV